MSDKYDENAKINLSNLVNAGVLPEPSAAKDARELGDKLWKDASAHGIPWSEWAAAEIERVVQEREAKSVKKLCDAVHEEELEVGRLARLYETAEAETKALRETLDKYHALCEMAIRHLQDNILPDSLISNSETVTRLLGVFDGPEQREAFKARAALAPCEDKS